MNKQFDVTAIGNAIMDLLIITPDIALSDLDLIKGTMRLIDEEEASYLTQNIENDAQITCGGSSANTLVGLSQLGCKTAFMGKTASDELGRAYLADLQDNGVFCRTNSLKDTDPAYNPTGRCHIFVSDADGERTMATYLGASITFNTDDVDKKLIQSSKYCYLEAYLWDAPDGPNSYRHVIEYAKKYDTKVAFSLSDPFCVERHHLDFITMMSDIDILFGNEEELKHLNLSVEDISCDIVVKTMSSDGCMVFAKGATPLHIPATPVEKVVDTTGAGDLFAAGFLYGVVNNKPLTDCGKLGVETAGKVIQKMGGRI